jgi:hypothetical protein
MLDLASKFSPYRCVHLRRTVDLCYRESKLTLSRSLFMWYMWRIEDVDISVLQ